MCGAVMRRWIPWLLTIVVAFASAPAAFAAECGPALYKRLTKALEDPNFKVLAQDWVTRFRSADPIVAKGMTKAALQKDVKALLEGFRDLPAGANPFSSEQEIYRAIGELTDDTYEGVPGLNETVGNLFADSAPNEKGAIFTLKVADETDLAAKIAPGNGAGFERSVSANGSGTRRYDMREPGLGAPAEIGGVVHENKNWTTALSGPNDFRLVGFASEFQNDILIHSTSNWNFYRINLRSAVEGQSALIRDRLAQEFESQLVTGSLTPDAIAALKQEFLARWNAGAAGGLVKYY